MIEKTGAHIEIVQLNSIEPVSPTLRDPRLDNIRNRSSLRGCARIQKIFPWPIGVFEVRATRRMQNEIVMIR